MTCATPETLRRAATLAQLSASAPRNTMLPFANAARPGPSGLRPRRRWWPREDTRWQCCNSHSRQVQTGLLVPGLSWIDTIAFTHTGLSSSAVTPNNAHQMGLRLCNLYVQRNSVFRPYCTDPREDVMQAAAQFGGFRDRLVKFPRTPFRDHDG
jgi:hypothetical protein